jgi:acylphosphatase
VQGVFFRVFVLHEAQRLGLSGSVWNRRDGSVEVEAWGSRAVLVQLVDLLHRGPPAAVVADVAVEWGDGPVAESGFRIEYE